MLRVRLKLAEMRLPCPATLHANLTADPLRSFFARQVRKGLSCHDGKRDIRSRYGKPLPYCPSNGLEHIIVWKPQSACVEGVRSLPAIFFMISSLRLPPKSGLTCVTLYRCNDQNVPVFHLLCYATEITVQVSGFLRHRNNEFLARRPATRDGDVTSAL